MGLMERGKRDVGTCKPGLVRAGGSRSPKNGEETLGCAGW